MGKSKGIVIKVNFWTNRRNEVSQYNLYYRGGDTIYGNELFYITKDLKR